MHIQYVLESEGIYRIFRAEPRFSMTAKRIELLDLLAFTMVSASLLVAGGIFHHLRTAQRELHNLWRAGYLGFHKYASQASGCFRRFYYLTSTGFNLLGKPPTPGHEIKAGAWEHDLVTATFLAHLFRCSQARQIRLRWYPPFALGEKICDGGVTLARHGKIMRSILLETDMGTHDQREIEEKIAAYVEYLFHSPSRMVMFLAATASRARQLQKLTHSVLASSGQAKWLNHFVFFCPLTFAPDVDLLSMKRPVYETGDHPASQHEK